MDFASREEVLPAQRSHSEHTVASSPSEGIGWRENGNVVSESAAQEATELEKLGRWRDGVHRGHTLLALSSYLKQEGK